MNQVRCFYKDAEGIHQVNVSDVASYSEAINEVKELLGCFEYYQTAVRVLAVVDNV